MGIIRMEAARAKGVGAPTYSAEATALFARMTTPPSPTLRALYDAFISDAKTDGWWVADAIYLFNSQDAQSAALNLVADQYNATAVNAPAFAAYSGYSGDGSSSYLDTNMLLSAAAHWSLTSGTLAAWRETGTSNGAIIGSEAISIRGAGSTTYNFQWLTGNFQRTVTSNVGFYALTRDGVTQQPYANGDTLASQSEAVATTPGGSRKFFFLRRDDSPAIYLGDKLSFGYVGPFLTGAQIDSMRSAVAAFRAGVQSL